MSVVDSVHPDGVATCPTRKGVSRARRAVAVVMPWEPSALGYVGEVCRFDHCRCRLTS